MHQGTHALTDVYNAFTAEITIHRGVFLKALQNQHTEAGIDLHLQYFAGWHGLIGLLDAWSRFCKDAIIASALGGVVTRSGSLLVASATVPVGISPLSYLKQKWPSKGYGSCYSDGPYWYVPSTADMAAKILSIGNYATFSAAILAKVDTPTELKACRNFLAHRNKGTQEHKDVIALRTRIGAGAATPHTEKLAEEMVSGNITLFEEWCIELDGIAATAIT